MRRWHELPQVEKTCVQCGAKWMTKRPENTDRCIRCALRNHHEHRRRKGINNTMSCDIPAAEVMRILDEAVADEIRMPWDKRKP